MHREYGLGDEFVKDAIRQTCNDLSINGRSWVDKTGMDLVARSPFFRYPVVIVGGPAAWPIPIDNFFQRGAILAFLPLRNQLRCLQYVCSE